MKKATDLLKATLSCLGLAAILFSILGGCKIVTKVPVGGKVTHQDGIDYCLPSQKCTTEVVDSFFAETYVAEPEDGYAFMQWKTLTDGFCGGSDQPGRCWFLANVKSF